MTTIEERFQAAVNVIKGLPKNGPYQPSNTMMLRFYGYYKQSIEGPCHQKKPPFWDIVGKAKWEAWNENRYLTKQQAMAKYVDSLREIIETMSYTENVQNFVGSLDGLDISLNDLDTVAPGMREVAETHPDSPFNSRAASPQRISRRHSLNLSIGGDLDNSLEHLTNGIHEQTNGHVEVRGSENISKTIPPLELVASIVEQSDDEYGDPFDLQHEFNESITQQKNSLQQINVAVKLINADVAALNSRTTEMEEILREMRLQLQLLSKFNNSTSRDIIRKFEGKSWWPFTDITPTWFALLIMWPFIFKFVKRVLPTTKRQ